MWGLQKQSSNTLKLIVRVCFRGCGNTRTIQVSPATKNNHLCIKCKCCGLQKQPALIALEMEESYSYTVHACSDSNMKVVRTHVEYVAYILLALEIPEREEIVCLLNKSFLTGKSCEL